MTVRIESRGGRRVYDIIVRGPDGKEVRERRNLPDAVRSATSVERWTKAREYHLTMHGREPEPSQAPTLSGFGPRWVKEYARAEGLKPSTIDTYETHLRLHLYPVLGGYRLNEIREPQVQRVKLHLGQMTAKTRRGVLATLANVLNTAERWGEIERAPRIELPRPADPVMTFYDFPEWERLVEGARLAGPMVYTAILLAGEAGLRRGELVALEQPDCAPQAVTVCRNEWKGKIGAPKGGKTRRIPLTARLAEAIAAVRHLRGKRLLWQSSGKKVKVTTLQSWLETACRRAGLPESRNLHKLRHTFCSHLAMRGATPKAIQELAGHADLKTTQRYMHLSPAHVESAIRLLEQPAPIIAAGAGVEQGNSKG